MDDKRHGDFYGYRTKRQCYEILRSQLENERSSFLPIWRDCADHISPHRQRFTTTESNRGERRNLKIIDSTATLAARTQRAGMMGGITSPARPWFRLTTPDPALAEKSAVKQWLQMVGSRMATVFLKSNLYNVLPIIYGDLGVFGTSAMFVEEDLDDVVRFYPFAVGSYMLASNHKLKVDCFIREFRMTVRQIRQKFVLKDDGKEDWSNVSSHVRSIWEAGEGEAWIDVVHIVKTNEEYDPRRLHAKYKKYVSCYYERGYAHQSSSNYLRGEDEEKFLSESGYDYFPILAPRWELNGEDVYGTSCPGRDAIGDVKQLQLGEKRSMQAIEKMINPPMTGPSVLKTQKASILPGDITYVDTQGQGQGFRPAHEVNFRIQELEEKQRQCRERISRAFYEDLFLMLAQSDRRQITAREIDERHEEKLLALGPVLEQLNQDLLDPLIDITFDIMSRPGRAESLIPPPPPELQGVPLKVEYISIMAQAQKLAGIGGIDRFMNHVGNMVKLTGDMSVADKVNIDRGTEHYADLCSVPPDMIRSDEEVAQMKASRAQAQQAEAAAMQAQAMTGAAKTMSETSLEGENALTALLRQSQAGQVVPQ